MPWFKVDDKFWSHPKVIRTSSLAIGVWTRVGSYTAEHLLDGMVDTATVYTICPESPRVLDRAIAELVSSGLWEAVGDRERQYHDWHDQQPTRESVEAKRRAAAERVQRWRERQQAASDADRDPEQTGPEASVTPLRSPPVTRY